MKKLKQVLNGSVKYEKLTCSKIDKYKIINLSLTYTITVRHLIKSIYIVPHPSPMGKLMVLYKE